MTTTNDQGAVLRPRAASRPPTPDIVLQMINESKDSVDFRLASLAVKNHVRSSRNPDANHAILVGLMVKGYYLMHKDGANDSIVNSVVSAIDQDPGE